MQLDKAGQQTVRQPMLFCCRLLRQQRRHLCSGLGGMVYRAGCSQSFGTFGVVKAYTAYASCATQRTTGQASETGVSIAALVQALLQVFMCKMCKDAT